MNVDYLERITGKRLTKAQIMEIMVDALEQMNHSNIRGRTIWSVTETAALNWVEAQ